MDHTFENTQLDTLCDKVWEHTKANLEYQGTVEPMVLVIVPDDNQGNQYKVSQIDLAHLITHSGHSMGFFLNPASWHELLPIFDGYAAVIVAKMDVMPTTHAREALNTSDPWHMETLAKHFAQPSLVQFVAMVSGNLYIRTAPFRESNGIPMVHDGAPAKLPFKKVGRQL